MKSPAFLPGPAPAACVDVIRDFESFLRLEPEWNELVDRVATTNPFLRHEWFRAWWECFGQGKELHIVVARRGGEVRGLAPLMFTRRPLSGIPMRRLEFIYNSHTPRCDFIIDRDSAGIFPYIWDHISRAPGWQALVLQQIPSDSETPSAIASLARRDGFLSGAWQATESPFVCIRGGWDGYYEKLSRKHRANMRNRFRRLDRIGDVDMEVVSREDAIQEALRAGLEIEATSWKGKAGTAVLSRPDLTAFYRNVASSFARHGWTRLHFLRVNGRRVAFDYSLLYANRLYVLKVGYDPRFAACSPYNSLCYLKLREAHATGLDEYDFLGSNDAWKLDWARETRPHRWIFVFPDSIAGRLLYDAKFRVFPALNRSRLYRSLRDAAASGIRGIHGSSRGASDE